MYICPWYSPNTDEHTHKRAPKHIPGTNAHTQKHMNAQTYAVQRGRIKNLLAQGPAQAVPPTRIHHPDQCLQRHANVTLASRERMEGSARDAFQELTRLSLDRQPALTGMKCI